MRRQCCEGTCQPLWTSRGRIKPEHRRRAAPALPKLSVPVRGTPASLRAAIGSIHLSELHLSPQITDQIPPAGRHSTDMGRGSTPDLYLPLIAIVPWRIALLTLSPPPQKNKLACYSEQEWRIYEMNIEIINCTWVEKQSDFFTSYHL